MDRLRNTVYNQQYLIPIDVQENSCLADWDDEYQSHELDEDKLLDLLEEKQKGGGLILEHHVTDIFPERWFDLVLVLRTDNTRLYDRLASRGYTGKKLEENIQCEIFQTILEEAKEAYREELVVELQSNTEEDMANNLERVLAWMEQWRKDRDIVSSRKRKAN
jgi:adenylate kinase